MKKMKPLWLRGVALAITGSLLLGARTGSVWADTSQKDEAAAEAADQVASGSGYAQPTNQLTVQVGYFGGPYYTKTVFYVDGDNLTLWDAEGNVVSDGMIYTEHYSYVDEGEQVLLVEAQGIYLSDFLELAGVDQNSVQYYHFRTTDEKTYSMTNANLCQLTRYYFSAIGDYTILDDYEDFASELQGSGTTVQPMLALTDNWNAEGQVNNAIRLLFGQTTPTDIHSADSCKWIHTMVIQLGGTPTVNAVLDLSSKVGSVYRVTVNLTTTTDDGRTTDLDATVAEQIARDLTVTSSNRNALNVTSVEDNGDGTFTATIEAGTGTAELSIGAAGYSGSMSEGTITLQAEDGTLSVLGSTGNIEVVTNSTDPSDSDPSQGDGTPGDSSGDGATQEPDDAGQGSTTPDPDNGSSTVPTPDTGGATTTPNPEPEESIAPTASPEPEESTAPATSPEPEGSTAPATSPEPEESIAPTTSPELEGSTAPATSPEPEESIAPTTSPEPEESTAPATSPEPETEGTATSPSPDRNQVTLITPSQTESPEESSVAQEGMETAEPAEDTESPAESTEPSATEATSPDQTVTSQNGDSTQTVQTTPQETPTDQSETVEETEIPEGEENETALLEGVTPDTEEAEVVNSIRLQRLTIDSDQGAVQNWRETDMAEDAQELDEDTDNPMLPVAAGMALAALCYGGWRRLRWYRRQLDRTDRRTNP